MAVRCNFKKLTAKFKSKRFELNPYSFKTLGQVVNFKYRFIDSIPAQVCRYRDGMPGRERVGIESPLPMSGRQLPLVVYACTIMSCGSPSDLDL